MDVTQLQSFVSNSLNTLIVIASLVAVFFLIKAGYLYITSTGNPDMLEDAKKTIRNALIGLLFVIGASVFSSLLHKSFITPHQNTSVDTIQIAPIEPVKSESGLSQILVDAIAGFIQNIVQSATKPVTDGIVTFLTTTPSVVSNSVVFNFWISMVLIVNTLFALIIGLIGLHFMSASTFGFEEMDVKQLLPRIALAFLGANTSIFLVDWIVQGCNVLISSLLSVTGGLNKAWIANAFDPNIASIEDTGLITLIFMLLFVILCVVLLLFYIMRLIIISLGAVLSPFIFLLWLLPKFNDFAEISAKTFIVNVYSIFVHVVTIQLASAFLTLPGQVGTNSLISVLVGIALLLTLLKTPQALVQLAFYTSFSGLMRRVNRQATNLLYAQKTEQYAHSAHTQLDMTHLPKKTHRKVIKG